MRRTLSLSIVCLVTLVAGCGNEESSSEGSGKPPANMCEAVAPAVPEDWKLTKTSAEKGKAKTDCTLADESGRTTLVVSVVKPKSGQRRRRLEGALRHLHRQPAGGRRRGVHQDRAGEAGGSHRRSCSEAVRLEGSEGVLWVTFRTNNPDHAAGAEDMMDDVEDAVSED